MGSIVLSRCFCGFEKRIALGGGLKNHTTYCAFPCYCNDCNSMFVANLFSGDINCSECGRYNTLPYDDDSMRVKVKPINLRPSITFVNQTFWEKLLLRKPKKIVRWINCDSHVFSSKTDSKLGRNLCLTDENYLCPSCQMFTLKFYSIGCWD